MGERGQDAGGQRGRKGGGQRAEDVGRNEDGNQCQQRCPPAQPRGQYSHDRASDHHPHRAASDEEASGGNIDTKIHRNLRQKARDYELRGTNGTRSDYQS